MTKLPKSAAITALYQSLSITLVRANARAFLSRAITDSVFCFCFLEVQITDLFCI